MALESPTEMLSTLGGVSSPLSAASTADQAGGRGEGGRETLVTCSQECTIKMSEKERMSEKHPHI